ncbi:MAG TPA: heme-binding protein [Stackebrandtia sp.]|jgi:uncharacterized protein GlcG (DUF336 family)|uniref:GlcG/HbpS family heme-binding protein n=1 Tax=Stackebrandtia sp. TaxID=2023065 RepID=UPI002D35D038|nr:heme-binding protein [Stackebrandtia sp.]HZE41012.1 heme-binding protein [Stackebrandtia sp.]
MNKRSLAARIGLGAALGLALAGGTSAVAAYADSGDTAAPAAAASDKSVVTTKTLSSGAAAKVAEAAQKEAAKQHQRVTVVIVDRAGNVIAEIKGDGAGPQSPESAERKAFTAVSFGKATSELAKNVDLSKPSTADIPGTLFLAGGVPVTADKAPIAGVGVAGAPGGDIDESIADAGLKALK